MRRLHGKLLRDRSQEPEPNPVEGLVNLVDAMLVLAVGIMLALIINWNVDIGTIAYTDEPASPVEFTDDDLTETDEPADKDLEEMGTVYYDRETGTYYIIQK